MLNNLKKYVISLISKGSGAGANLLINALISRTLVGDASGVIFYCISLAAFLSILSRGGLDTLCLKLVSTSVEEQKKPLFLQAIKISITLTIPVLLVGIIIASLAPVTREHFESATILLVCLITSITITNISCETIKSQKKLAEALFWQTAFQPIVALLILYNLGPSISTAILAFSISHITCAIASLIRATSLLPPSATPVETLPLQRLKSSVIFMFIASINILIETSDTLILGLMVQGSDLSVYYICAKIAALSTMILFIINGSIAPDIARNWNSNKKETFRIIKISSQKMLGIAVGVLTFTILFHDFILGFFGELQKEQGKFPLIALSAGYFFVLATGPLGVFMTMTGHQRKYLNGNIIVCLLNIPLNFILISKFGINGACIATAIALTLKNLILFYQYQKIKMAYL